MARRTQGLLSSNPAREVSGAEFRQSRHFRLLERSALRGKQYIIQGRRFFLDRLSRRHNAKTEALQLEVRIKVLR